MTYPKIYLAIDNCFASKRWTDPADWMRVVKSLGISYVEASADTECDPLYMGPAYLNNWIKKVNASSKTTSVKVVNLYSGHGTYATLGLAHTEESIRNRFLNEWLKPMSVTAGKVNAGLGFFCHAFPDAVLQNSEQYYKAEVNLYTHLAELSEYAAQNGCESIGVEQMYTPHQIPWTLKGAEKMLREVNRQSSSQFYITIDVGHQCGQRRFMRPGFGNLKEAFRDSRDDTMGLWLGPQTAYSAFSKAEGCLGIEENAAIEKIEREMDKYPYLFAEYEDGDPYLWLEKLGAYSPIIHLQQTSGKSSAHLPFTKENNKTGIISGEKVLRALLTSYQATENNGFMPEKSAKIFLTLEMFSGTADMNHDILNRLRETVAYWRQFVPEDGIPLDQLAINKGEAVYG